MVTEILSLSGLDFVLVDNEHGPGEVLTVANQLQQTEPTLPLWSVFLNDHVMIKKLLDVGVESIMVPMVENAEEVRAAVSAVRYPREEYVELPMLMRERVSMASRLMNTWRQFLTTPL